jgi:hypothetical protein
MSDSSGGDHRDGDEEHDGADHQQRCCEMWMCGRVVFRRLADSVSAVTWSVATVHDALVGPTPMVRGLRRLWMLR